MSGGGERGFGEGDLCKLEVWILYAIIEVLGSRRAGGGRPGERVFGIVGV